MVVWSASGCSNRVMMMWWGACSGTYCMWRDPCVVWLTAAGILGGGEACVGRLASVWLSEAAATVLLARSPTMDAAPGTDE